MENTSIFISVAKPRDGGRINRYIKRVYATSDHLITRADEFRSGMLRQRLWVANRLVNPNEVCFVAKIGKEIVGMLDCWTDGRARVRHVTTFAMSVDIDHRGKGIGAALLDTFIDWVKNHKTLEKIELHVHEDNAPARALYEKAGFEVEGCRKGAVKYEDGRVVDDYIMALWPKKKK